MKRSILVVKPPLRRGRESAGAVVSVPVSHEVQAHLESLVRTGLYGATPADAAERLISRGLEVLLEAGIITGRV
jgi:hypothetical protein